MRWIWRERGRERVERGNTHDEQQDLQQAAVLLGASKADIYRLTTAVSAWAKNTLSDILGWHFWSSWHWTADGSMLEITQTGFMPPHRRKITATLVTQVNHFSVRWSMHRGISAKLSVPIAISTGILCFQFSRWRLRLAKVLSPLKDRCLCVFFVIGLLEQKLVESRFSEDSADLLSPAGEERIRHSSMKVIPSILQS